MSISDTEDLDKSTKRSSASLEGDRDRTADEDGIKEEDGTKNTKRDPLEPNPSHGGTLLTAEQRREVSYRRAAALLRSDVPVRLPPRRSEEDGDGDCFEPEITVTPSLVSLSDGFFAPPQSHGAVGGPAAASSGTGEGSAEDGTESINAAAAGRTAFDSNIRGRSSAAASAASSIPATTAQSTASAASATVTSASPNQRRVYGSAADPTFAFPSLRPRLLGPEAGPSLRDSLRVGGGALPPIMEPHHTWPVGPQGAPVPEYLVEERRREGADEDELNDLSDLTAERDPMAFLQGLAEMRRRQLESDAVAQLGRGGDPLAGPSPLSSISAGSGGRDRNRIYINAVKSLDHSLRRLEKRLDSSSNAGGSGSRNRVQGLRSPSRALPGDTPSCNVDALEFETVSGLMEIMLHPPLSLKGNKYGFGDGEECKDLGDEMDTAFMDDGDDDDALEASGGDACGAAPRTGDDVPGDDVNSSQDSISIIQINPASSKDDVDMDADDDDGSELLMGEHDRPTKPLPDPPTHLSRPSRYSSLPSIIDKIGTLGDAVPRRVCQYPFKRNDIVWVCRTCQADETCVLCHECFSNSDHEGHDVAFYHAQAGGCCDCGDPDAWDAKVCVFRRFFIRSVFVAHLLLCLDPRDSAPSTAGRGPACRPATSAPRPASPRRLGWTASRACWARSRPFPTGS